MVLVIVYIIRRCLCKKQDPADQVELAKAKDHKDEEAVPADGDREQLGSSSSINLIDYADRTETQGRKQGEGQFELIQPGMKRTEKDNNWKSDEFEVVEDDGATEEKAEGEVLAVPEGNGASDSDVVHNGGMMTKGQVAKDSAELDAVRLWLRDTVKLSGYGYEEKFISNGYEKLDFIKEIQDVSELIEIDIVDASHQTRLMKEIQQLRANNVF